jgi:hypothetical protein
MFALQKVVEREDRAVSTWKVGRLGEEVTQTMYTHVSKCEKDKTKGENNKWSIY